MWSSQAAGRTATAARRQAACEQAATPVRCSGAAAHPRAVAVVLGHRLPEQLLHLQLAALQGRRGRGVVDASSCGSSRTGQQGGAPTAGVPTAWHATNCLKVGERGMQAPKKAAAPLLALAVALAVAYEPATPEPLACCVSTTTTPPLCGRLAAHSCVRILVSWAMSRLLSHHDSTTAGGPGRRTGKCHKPSRKHTSVAQQAQPLGAPGRHSVTGSHGRRAPSPGWQSGPHGCTGATHCGPASTCVPRLVAGGAALHVHFQYFQHHLKGMPSGEREACGAQEAMLQAHQ